MPRKNKTDKKIGKFSETAMKQAVQLVLEGSSIRQAADRHGLHFQTVHRYVKKFQQNPDSRLCPNYKVRQIFTDEQEKILCDYIVSCSKMFYGLSRDDTRRLAYEMALKNQLPVPETWRFNESATLSWIKGFQKRHPNLSLRTPEGCSLSRATGFNKYNVEQFFSKLEEVLKRNPRFGDGSRIFNLDETGSMTVQKQHKVFAEKGSRQVSKATSAERGTLVTTCCIVGASGISIPPVMIFPRVHFKDFMINGAPPGCLGLASKTGWMTTECFIQVVKHFIKHTSSSVDNPSLLIMDNHQSHLSIQSIDLCKNSGVTILTIPPHCTNKLQPLDVGLLKPFQTFYSAALDSWMMAHPGQTFTIYNVAAS
ncbi:tigger transposable element-derived protein 6-like [Photinus pyralis]|uniref:tigger transposable element-derived protein 6-like n=1 Tax=Photinus pyralis TaxID=7054 RepID=UPI00126711E4|nr:tigger transposable element-derived protein 6-like [Photinus pyralis]